MMLKCNKNIKLKLYKKTFFETNFSLIFVLLSDNKRKTIIELHFSTAMYKAFL